MCPPNPGRTSYSIIVPVHDNAATIGRVARAFLTQLDRCPGGEIVVVDDGSGDHPERVLGEALADDRLRLVRNEESQGAAAARNRGVETAQGSLLILSDGDCVPGDRFVEAHLAAHCDHPDANVVVLGNLAYPPEIRVTPLMRLGNVVESWNAVGTFRAGRSDGSVPGGSSDFSLLRTTNMSMKREFLGHGFREMLGASSGWEDADLGLRLAAAGMIVQSAPDAVSWHHHFLEPMQYMRKTVRYGSLFRTWIEHLEPDAREEVRSRLSHLADRRRLFTRDNARKLWKRLAVNRFTYRALLFLARRLETRWERLSANLYWKLHPHLFLSGYRGRPVPGIADGNGMPATPNGRA